MKKKFFRLLSLKLAVLMLFQLAIPTASWALTGGPSQPEVESFSPVSTSDMVDIFTGDFNYNLPLLDVEGYPINISYSNGITPDQEASWVGLGWNINAGNISRSTRGLPDDFKGEKVLKKVDMKENKTWGLTLGASVATEVLGFDAGSFIQGGSLAASLGIKYNNYTGYSSSISITPGLSSGDESKLPFNASLGISASSDAGASVQPSVGLSYVKNIPEGEGCTSGSFKSTLSIGGAFNSRGGFTSLTISNQNSLSVKHYSSKAQKDLKSSTSAPYQPSTSWGFGTTTYVPSGEMNYTSLGLSGRFSVGGELAPLYVGANISGYSSTQRLESNTTENPAFGYLYSEKANGVTDLMDFNRDNQGQSSKNTLYYSNPNFTYDLFNVQAQGMGGSYRPVRNDVGVLHTPTNKVNPSDNLSLEVELGIGGVGKVGVSVGYSRSKSESGEWKTNNAASSRFGFTKEMKGELYEPFYFKNASEFVVDANPEFFQEMGGFLPIRAEITPLGNSSTLATGKLKRPDGGSYVPSTTKRTNREKRGQLFTYLTRSSYTKHGLDDKYINSYYSPNLTGNNEIPGHHIAEVTSLSTDGSRYVFGLAAYNVKQEEYSFAIGASTDNSAGPSLHQNSGLVYFDADNCAMGNPAGRDGFYSCTETPPFAHSYLLTSVLSSDYIDSDDQRGPSDDDFGSYTKFDYQVIHNYKWRTPYAVSEQGNENIKVANYNSCLLSDKKDDRASFVYGEKDLYFLEKIETKNYVAIFKLSPRKDARGAENKFGGIDENDSRAMKKLDEIVLLTKSDFLENCIVSIGPDGNSNYNLDACTPVKTVHFEYSYELCQGETGIPNFFGSGELGRGKLTLKKIYFTYQNSKKAKFNAYSFEYNNTGLPDSAGGNALTKNSPIAYGIKDYDRWGNLQLNDAPVGYVVTSDHYPNSEYPYTKQPKNEEEIERANVFSSAWALSKIKLPSGGVIEVEYEQDTYQFVQHLEAKQMTQVLGSCSFDEDGASTGSTISVSNTHMENAPTPIQISGTSNNLEKNRCLLFAMNGDENVTDYLNVDETISYKVLIPYENALGSTSYEYVPGYAVVDNIWKTQIQNIWYGVVKLKPEKFKDNESAAQWNPISKSTIQYCRMNLPKLINDFPSGEDPNLKNALIAIANAFGTVKELFKNPNKYVYDKGIGKHIISHKSIIRVGIPSGKKYGGGARVKRIISDDKWADMTSLEEGPVEGIKSKQYGQIYTYEGTDGKSWGVAAYEPQIGGEENPWKSPVYYSNTLRGTPDPRFMQEMPICEAFFPSPQVGYSRVEVRSLKPAELQPPLPDGEQAPELTRHATGKVVHEFYTARDFPTLTRASFPDRIPQKSNPLSINNLLKINIFDNLTVSQGFVVETNDMHGKPKSQEVFAEDQEAAISSITYKYDSTPITRDGKSVSQLNNNATVINSDGSATNAQLGVMMDVYHDSQRSSSSNDSYELKLNFDITLLFGITIPTVWPSVNREKTEFKSITTTKVIQRFGILKETVATQDGSSVSTKTLAYDAETGQGILTSTVNDYDDEIFTLNYPAYWYYKEMGPAYKNIGFTDELWIDETGTAPVPNAKSKYFKGDVLALAGEDPMWVKEVTDWNIKLIDKSGNPPAIGVYNSKVVRSGAKNMQLGTMASITTMSNPLMSIASNLYQNILQASAIEYTNEWPTSCECLTNELGNLNTTNPFIMGTTGYWKPTKSYLYLTDRTQTDEMGNSNLRKDGFFSKYSPFYKRNSNGTWQKDFQNWTYSSEVTMFSPFGQELENRDALGRYSSATFGYRQSLPISVAANAKYNETGFESFEDYTEDGSTNCADEKFKFQLMNGVISDQESHSGRYSLFLSHTSAKSNSNSNDECVPINCSLSANMVGEDQILIIGGVPPYSVDWSIQLGAPMVYNTLNTQGEYVVNIIGDEYLLLLNVTDSDGNTISELFQNN